MKPRTLLILLLVVLALGAFIWFYERELPSSEERADLEKKLFRLEKKDVAAVTIQSAKGQVRLERVEAPAKQEDEKKKEEGEEETVEVEPVAEWRLTKPLAARADSFAVDRLLDALAALEKTRTLDEVNSKDVGLDQPRATVRLATKGGERILRLGAAVPTGGSLIAGLEGEKGAYVVSDTILAELEKEPGDWRDRQTFRVDREAIRRLTLTGAEGGPVVLARRPNGFWIERPLADRADRDLVDGLLSDLTGLTAERFLDGSRPAAELGLAPPQATVEVFAKGAAPARVDLGSPVSGATAPEEQVGAPRIYARTGGATFEARTPLAESVRRAPADWRAVQLSAFEVHDVESFTVKDDRTAVSLTRAEPDWKRGDTTISYLPVSDLLFALTGARADRLLALEEAQALRAGLARPLLTFELRSKEKGSETLTLYPPIAAGAPARASGRQTVLLLPADTLKEIREKLQAVRSAKPVKEEKKEGEEKEEE